MESPKFIICPECHERYNDTNKRRLIDTCGHPRCYSCLFKDQPCPVCSKLPQRRQRARTLSNEKLLDAFHGDTTTEPRHQRFLSDTTTFTGMFRKDSYLRTLYSYDPGSKGYNMEEKIRRYRSLEILNDRTRKKSNSPDFLSDVFVSPQDTTDQRSLSSSIDELHEDAPTSSTSPEPKDKTEPPKLCHKAWPSCPELSIQENIWQMRPAIERRKRPSSLYQTKYSTSSPRSSVYSPRSSGYWSELEQLSESESFTSPPPNNTETSPPSQDTAVNDVQSDSKTLTTPRTGPSSNSRDVSNDTQAFEKSRETGATGAKNLRAWQMTRGVFQQWRSKPNRTRSTECLRVTIEKETVSPKSVQRLNSVPVERHTKKISENNVQMKAYMTDV